MGNNYVNTFSGNDYQEARLCWDTHNDDNKAMSDYVRLGQNLKRREVQIFRTRTFQTPWALPTKSWQKSGEAAGLTTNAFLNKPTRSTTL